MRKTSRKRPPRSQPGQAIVLIAMGMIAFLAFVVLAIDGGKYYDQRRTAQNAADIAALAGLHYFHTQSPNTNDKVLGEIQRVAGLNGVPNATNGTNVTAYWLDKTGHYVNANNSDGGTVEPPPSTAQISGTGSKPGNAVAIKVRAMIPYTTFIGHMIGQKDLTAQADGVASELTTAFTDSNFDSKTSVYIGGAPGCSSVFSIAADRNSNSFDLGDNAYINGSGGRGGGNSQQGLYKQGDGTAYFSGTSGDLQASGNGRGGGSIVNGWTNPWLPHIYPDFFYIDVKGADHLIEAEDFRPTTDVDLSSPWDPAVYTKNYVVQAYKAAGSSPANYFHYVPGSGGPDFAKNGAALNAAMSAGGPGIYFIDGNVTVTNNWSDGYGLVATGKVEIAAGSGNTDPGAANDPSGWGWGLSILAGYKPANPQSKCAVGKGDPNYDPAVWTSAQQAGWKGILYAPFGSVNVMTNRNNKAVGPMVAASFVDGDGGNANSVSFGQCPSCWIRPPTYTFGLIS